MPNDPLIPQTKHCLTATVMTGLLLATGTAQATTVQIVDDTFNGGSETPNDDPGVPLDVAWSRIQPNANATIGATKGVGGTAALGDDFSSNQYRGMIGLLPSSGFTLTNVGDSIVLEADLRSNNAPALPGSGAANGYRVGLFSSSSTGYFIDVGVLDEDVTSSFGSLTLEEDTGGTNLAGNDGNSVVRDSIASGAPVIDTNDYRHFELTLTRTVAGVQVDADYENGAFTLSYLDTSPVTTVDRIFFGAGGHSVDYWVDNVTVVTTVIPEPGSLALMGLGGLLILRRRRG